MSESGDERRRSSNLADRRIESSTATKNASDSDARATADGEQAGTPRDVFASETIDIARDEDNVSK